MSRLCEAVGRADFVSGGARLDLRLAHVIEGTGMTVLDGYGLTSLRTSRSGSSGSSDASPPKRDELTRTLELERRQILEHFDDEVEAIYSDRG